MPTKKKSTSQGANKPTDDASKKPPNDLERWRDAAAAILQSDNPLKLPYEDALREAGAVAGFVEKYWAKTTERPGLSRVPKRVPQTMPEEIRSLVAGTQMAQTALLLVVDPVVATKGDRARFLVNELESHIEFLLDDDVEEPADKQLEQLQAFHADDGQRSAPLAQALRDYGTFAKSLQDRLVENDTDFNPAWIDEALALADELSRHPPPAGATTSPAGVSATKLRNQMLVLLMNRVAAVRKAAKHVFRGFPAIIQECTSTYERRRRTAARRAKLAEANQAAPAAEKATP